MTTKQIAQTAVGLGSLALVARSGKMLKDSMKSPSPKKIVKGMVDLTLGTALLVPSSQIANKL